MKRRTRKERGKERRRRGKKKKRKTRKRRGKEKNTLRDSNWVQKA